MKHKVTRAYQDVYNKRGEFLNTADELYVREAAGRLAEYALKHNISIPDLAKMGYDIFNDAYMKVILKRDEAGL